MFWISRTPPVPSAAVRLAIVVAIAVGVLGGVIRSTGGAEPAAERADRIPPTHDAVTREGHADRRVLRVGTFNAQFLPSIVAHTHRASALAERIRRGGYDIIAFSEVFSERVRTVLVRELAGTFPYIVSYIGSARPRQDSGLMLFSTLPFDVLDVAAEPSEPQIKTVVDGNPNTRRVLFHEFTDCTGIDCLAGKGVAYVRVNVVGRPVHVFFTHLQASYNRQDQHKRTRTESTRANQLREMAVFVRDVVGNSPTENTLILGDLNVDGRTTQQSDSVGAGSGGDEWQYMIQTLSEPFAGHLEDVWHRYAPRSSAGLTHPASDPKVRLDYVLLSVVDPQLPLIVREVDLPPELAAPYYPGDGASSLERLSDHLGVRAVLRIAIAAAPVATSPLAGRTPRPLAHRPPSTSPAPAAAQHSSS